MFALCCYDYYYFYKIYTTESVQAGCFKANNTHEKISRF